MLFRSLVLSWTKTSVLLFPIEQAIMFANLLHASINPSYFSHFNVDAVASLLADANTRESGGQQINKNISSSQIFFFSLV